MRGTSERVCPHCDYPLGTRPDAGVCPNCGTFYTVESAEDDGPCATAVETLEYLIWPGVLLGTSVLAVLWTQFAWDEWRGFVVGVATLSAVLFFIAAVSIFIGCVRTGAVSRDSRVWGVLGALTIATRAMAVLNIVLLVLAGLIYVAARMYVSWWF